MQANERGQLIVISAPSGAGKSTVISELLRTRGDIFFSVSFTTRKPRAGETDGVNYNFISKETFEEMIRRDEFLEHALYVDHYYGTSLKAVEEKLDSGVDVLLEIDVQGAANVRKKCPEAVLIFIVPPSFEELSNRLHGRHTDPEEVIAGRLRQAKEEYKEIPNYDYLVVNDTVSAAVSRILSILTAEGCRTKYHLDQMEGAR